MWEGGRGWIVAYYKVHYFVDCMTDSRKNLCNQVTRYSGVRTERYIEYHLLTPSPLPEKLKIGELEIKGERTSLTYMRLHFIN